MPSRHAIPRASRAWLLCLLTWLAPGAVHAQSAADALRGIAAAAQLPGLRWPRFPDHAGTLAALYEPRAWAPLWLDGGGEPNAPAREAIEVLQEAALHGLEPDDYDAQWLATEAERLGDERESPPDRQARFDAALSVALLRHVSDLHVGRVNPRTVKFDYDVAPKQLDLAVYVADAVRDDRVRDAVAAAAPVLPQHRLLEEQLARYREIAADASLAPLAIDLRTAKRRRVAPGDPFEEGAALSKWLIALGDLPPDAPAAPLVLDGALLDALRRFQARHGLDPDGVIGPATARALAVPAPVRVRQIELALERLRWIPPLDDTRVVFVNVAGFQLSAFDRVGPDEGPVLQMAVVVGKAARTQTPVFAGTMRTVVFAPYWHVPRSIVRNEILPKQASNPGYVASQNMEIVMGRSAVATTPESLAALAAGDARLRQRPGPRNSLGRVKFLFPNEHDVYLHDTPSQSLFQRARRDFSHGCIRVADPEALARWVLGPEGWDAERVAAGLALRRELPVPLAKPFPVVIHYTTALARRDGTIAFYPDIYGHDAALERALAGGYPYRP